MGGAAVNGDEQEEFIRAALDMETSVESAIAENSLNPANIEAAIRKALLPRLFGLTGLDKAKVITERIVERSEEHTSELQSLMRISYAVFCLKKKRTFKR